MKKIVCALTCLAILSGCATHPDKIAASSVSSLQYQDYNCKQIAAELNRVERKSNELYFRLGKTASNDSAQMAVGMLLLWPTLFFLEGGDGPEAAEYARLKGELDALETVSIQKKCGLKFPSPPQMKEAVSKQNRSSNN